MLLSAPYVVTPSRAAPKRIIVCDAGDVISRIYTDLIYKSFTQETGIEVIGAISEHEPVAQIQTFVNTKRYLWDMVVLGPQTFALLTTTDVYLEKHELEHEPIIQTIAPQFMSPYGVGARAYSMTLAYRTDTFKDRVPEAWQDLWDINRFPGRRGLRKHPFDTIEIALMADGVPPGKVYPCDLNRAFRSLDKIRPHVTNWWTGGPQTEQLLKSGEIDLISAWTVRVLSAINAGIPLAFSWNQHVYGCNRFAILKGTPNADACRQFIKFASNPKRQALLAPYGIAPTQPDAFSYIDLKHAQLLPTYPDNLKKGLLVDAAYWTKHQQAATERFNNWIIS
jgi:putative spermidine/putrescine transport system substrate-binding protein